MRKVALAHGTGALGLGLLVAGSYWGLAVSPPERYMGEVGRILYLHVPTAWGALITLTAAFVAAVGLLWQRGPAWDDVLVACVEVGVLLTALLLIQGSIWARPTWGVYWTWDPRLTTSAILLVAFVAVLGMRTFVDDPTRRAVWSAVATVVAFVDVPIVYFSIKWWRTLHQPFSTAETIATSMRWPMYVNALALLFIAAWLVGRRTHLARLQRLCAQRDLSAQGDDGAPPSSPMIAGD